MDFRALSQFQVLSLALVTLALCLAQAAPRTRSDARPAARPNARPEARPRPQPKAQPKAGIFDDAPSFNQRKSFEEEEFQSRQARPARKARPEPQVPLPVAPIVAEPSVVVPVAAEVSLIRKFWVIGYSEPFFEHYK